MTNEQIYFINMLSDFLAGRSTASPDFDAFDWDKFAFYAKKQQVEGIAFHQCKAHLPQKVEKVLGKSFNMEIVCSVNRDVELAKINKAFNAAGIDAFMVKGPVVARYYPIKQLRAMGDIDIVVLDNRRAEAADILDSMGYQVGERYSDVEWHIEKGYVNIEMHEALLIKNVNNPDKLVEFFNDYKDYLIYGADMGKDDKHGFAALDLNFHFVFMLAHLRKHLLNDGIGFRQFMDIAVTVGSIDWDKVVNICRELDMERLLHMVIGLCHEWFGTKLPDREELFALPDGLADEAAEKMFNDGIFAHADESNRHMTSVTLMTNTGESFKKSRFKYTLRRAFPPYGEMRGLPYVKFVDGRPYLLPAAWVKRAFYRLGSSWNRKDFIARATVPEDKAIKRKEFFDKMGV